MSNYYTHGCGQRVSKGAYHCGTCHSTFNGLTAFDTHRKGLKCATIIEKPDPYSRDAGFYRSGKNNYWSFGTKIREGEGWW